MTRAEVVPPSVLALARHPAVADYDLSGIATNPGSRPGKHILRWPVGHPPGAQPHLDQKLVPTGDRILSAWVGAQTQAAATAASAVSMSLKKRRCTRRVSPPTGI